MKVLFLLAILAVCLKPCHAVLTDEKALIVFMRSWTDPPGNLANKISLSTDQYAYWTSLTKYVPIKEKLQPTYVERFCTCKRSNGSFLDLVKRGSEPTPPERKKIRKEWRRMSRGMRTAFIRHFNNLAVKQEGETQSRLHVLANFHRKNESEAAHRGPAFLPWHREYLYRLENALADDGYTGGLPYWNSGLDHGAGNAANSAIFTPRELGITRGVVNEPFQPGTIEGDCLDALNYSTIMRDVIGQHGRLLSRQKRDNLPWEANYKEFARRLEGAHNGVHTWFGRKSHMMKLPCVGFDPIFYMHHAYIDYLWEEYRQNYQTLHDRENDYPTDFDVPAKHQKYSTMFPFDNMENIDGLKNQYTNTFYTYQPSPDECVSDENCRSAFLWCNNGFCQAKVKSRSPCDGVNAGRECYCRRGMPLCDEDRGRCRCQGSGK